MCINFGALFFILRVGRGGSAETGTATEESRARGEGAPDFGALSKASMGYTGAEIQAVCREALLLALRERREGRTLAEGGGAAAAASHGCGMAAMRRRSDGICCWLPPPPTAMRACNIQLSATRFCRITGTLQLYTVQYKI